MPERNPRIEDLLTAYEMGLLEGEDARRVEEALLNDADLLDDLYDAAPFAEAMRNEPGRVAAAGRTALKPAAPSLLERVRGLFRVRVLAPAAITAAFALALVLAPGLENVLSRLAVVEPLDYARVEVRAADDSADAAFAAAMDAYLDEDWSLAVSGLAETRRLADEAWPRRDQTLLYLGSAELMAGDADAAVVTLAEVASSPLPPVAEQARWLLAQAYLLTERGDEARETLESLRRSPVYGGRAEALLVELDAAL